MGEFSKVQMFWWLHLYIQNVKSFVCVVICDAGGRRSALMLSVQHSALDISLLRDFPGFGVIEPQWM